MVDKTARERKLESESNIIDRRVPSPDTLDYIKQCLGEIDDPATAKTVAKLNEVVTGEDPPDTETFRDWHKELNVSLLSVDVLEDSVEIEYNIDLYKYYTEKPTVHLRISERNSLNNDLIYTDEVEVEAEKIHSTTLNDLKNETEYNIRVIVDCQGDRKFSNSETFKTL